MFVSFVIVCCVGSGLYNRLISRSEESYHVCVSTMRRLKPELGCCATEGEKDFVKSHTKNIHATFTFTSLLFLCTKPDDCPCGSKHFARW
jgi:hypothetical protein